jgi:hypothetical protein
VEYCAGRLANCCRLQGQHRSCVAEMERHGDCREQRDGEHPIAGPAEVQQLDVASSVIYHDVSILIAAGLPREGVRRAAAPEPLDDNHATGAAWTRVGQQLG